jgi:CDP-glucose 4,6-dehydratase
MNEMVENDVWKDRKVLITGANGFLGSYISKLMHDTPAEVYGMVRDHLPSSNFNLAGLDKTINIVHGSLEDFDAVKRIINEYEIDTVFHVGAQAIVRSALADPLQTFRSNIMGTINVLEACRRIDRQVRAILIASSDKAYGSSAVLPYKEDFPLKGEFPYEVSKSCVDLISQSYFNSYGLPLAITRCGNIYGGGDSNYSRLVPNTIVSAMADKNPVLRSNGKYIRDFIYVEDIAEAYVLLAEKIDQKGVRGEAFNFSYELKKQVIEVVNDILRLMDKKHLEPVIMDQAEKEIVNQYLSCEKAKRVLGWAPRHNYEEGIIKTIEWYMHHHRKA